MALFGSGNMHCWASNIDEFLARFTDTRKIDKSILMDDSAYRYRNKFYDFCNILKLRQTSYVR